MLQVLNVDSNEQQKESVMKIVNTKNLIVAYHSDEPKNGVGICTDGIAAAFLIKTINNSVVTVAHSHYDEFAPAKLKMKIINNYYFLKKEITIIFTDTTISKSSFEQFLFYLTEMIPLVIDHDQAAKLNIVFQDHHLGPMQKVITQISYFAIEDIDQLPEKLTTKGQAFFKRIQYLLKTEKLFFTKVTSNACENNQEPSSELLLKLTKPLNNLNKEQLFFIAACILSEKVSIFAADDEIVTQAFINFKNIGCALNEQEIIDLLDYLDDKLASLAAKINTTFPFNEIKLLNDYSSILMAQLFSSDFVIKLLQFANINKIPLSKKRIIVESSTKPLISLHIKEQYHFVVTPFPRQSITRALTIILEKVRKSIEQVLNIKIVAFLLPNDSGVVSVIPYNDDVYCKLNDPQSAESLSLPAPNFIRVGHVNAFVLKASDLGNYATIFKNNLSTFFENKNVSDKVNKIDSVKNYLARYDEKSTLNIAEINNEQLLLPTATRQERANEVTLL